MSGVRDDSGTIADDVCTGADMSSVVDLSVVVQHSCTSWTPVVTPGSSVGSRRASWQPAPRTGRDSAAGPTSVRLSVPCSATVQDVVLRVLELCPSADVPALADNYELVDVQLDCVGRSVAERVLRHSDSVTSFMHSGHYRHLFALRTTAQTNRTIRHVTERRRKLH